MTQRARTVLLRDPRPGDMGWVVQQHGALYWDEFGWNRDFEALVAEIAAGMIRTHDAAWERGWIAELDGERVGAVFVVRKSAAEAQLRLLILTPRRARAGPGRPPDRRMHRLRACQGLRQAGAVDQRQSAGSARHLCQAWFQTDGKRALSRLRARPGRRALGA